MCPEYGATVGFFPSDEESVNYLRATGRDEADLELVTTYLKNQNMYGIPKAGEVEYSEVLMIDLDAIEPSIAGPKTTTRSD